MEDLYVDLKEKSYQILFRTDFSGLSAELVRLSIGKKLLLVTDSNVEPLWSNAVLEQLSGFDTELCVLPAGEEHKGMDGILQICAACVAHGMDRDSAILALGGGVVGDMAGFAASVYLRGIRFVQFPTTVLAAVDSSVGGKTAIDLPAGKNLAGSFYQPEIVICDTGTLDTLPEREYSSGFAEIIKYAVIAEPKLLDMIQTPERDIDEIIEICVKIKRDIVEADEFEAGQRQLLNFGHTIGHAVEKASDFKLLHGEAVAVGMVMIAKAAVRKGICTEECLDDIVSACKKEKLPVSADYSCKELMDMICSDKKVRGNTINVILPEHTGKCEISNITIEEMSSLLDMALQD